MGWTGRAPGMFIACGRMVIFDKSALELRRVCV